MTPRLIKISFLIFLSILLLSYRQVSAAYNSIIGDLNQDSQIDIKDFNILVNKFGNSLIIQDRYQFIPQYENIINLYPGAQYGLGIKLLHNGNDVTSDPKYYYEWIVEDNPILDLTTTCHTTGCTHATHALITSKTEGITKIRVYARSFPDHNLIGVTQYVVQVFPTDVPACDNNAHVNPDAGNSPLSVTLYPGGSGNLVDGFQIDYEGDGFWDTPIIQAPMDHIYYQLGNYQPKYRVINWNNKFSDCLFANGVTLTSSTPFPTPSITTPKNPVNWHTSTINLTADDYYVIVNGIKFTPPNDSVEVRSDPGNNSYTTLEITWHQYGREMRNYYYFKSDGQNWYSDEIRTLDANESIPQWIYFTGKFFNVPLNTTYRGNVVAHSDPDVWQNNLSQIHFENLNLEVF